MKNEIRKNIENSIANIQQQLEVSCLDGTPYMVVLDMPSLTPGETYPVVFGEWPEKCGSSKIVKGWRALDLAPDSFCGVIFHSSERASMLVHDLHSLGFRSARVLHRQAALQARLEIARQLLADLQ